MPGTCALSVHIALEWIGKPYQLVVMKHGDNRAPDYLAINPGGKVPAVMLDNGRVFTEAAAILAWLVDRHPEAAIGASVDDSLERFALYETLSYLTSEVHVAFGPFFAPQRFIDDESKFEDVKRKSLEQVAAYMATLDARLAGRTTLFGDRSVADAYLYVLTRWVDNLPGGIRTFFNLARFRAALEQDAGVARALADQGMKPLGAG
jgi:glutathione S-transferase